MQCSDRLPSRYSWGREARSSVPGQPARYIDHLRASNLLTNLREAATFVVLAGHDGQTVCDQHAVDGAVIAVGAASARRYG